MTLQVALITHIIELEEHHILNIMILCENSSTTTILTQSWNPKSKASWMWESGTESTRRVNSQSSSPRMIFTLPLSPIVSSSNLELGKLHTYIHLSMHPKFNTTCNFLSFTTKYLHPSKDVERALHIPLSRYHVPLLSTTFTTPQPIFGRWTCSGLVLSS